MEGLDTVYRARTIESVWGEVSIMTSSWYVLRSKPHKDVFLAEQLGLYGIETFAPRLRVQVVNPRARTVRPYFPGYVFTNVDMDKLGLSTLHYMPGSAGLVMFGGIPASVPDELISAIRQRVEDVNATGGELAEVLRPGEMVYIRSGPFAGYEAVFDARLPGKERVRVLLQLLHDRQTQVELPAEQVVPQKQSRPFEAKD